MARPIDILSDPFYNSEEWFSEYAPLLKETSQSPLSAQYIDPKTKAVRQYTTQQVLDGNNPIEKEASFILGDRVTSNTENYTRNIALGNILNDPIRLNQLVSSGLITEEKLREDYDEGLLERYDNKLRSFDSTGGLSISEGYVPRAQKKDITGKYTDPITGEIVEYRLPGDKVGTTGLDAIDAGIDFFYDSNEEQREQYLLRGINKKYLDSSYEQNIELPVEYETRLARSPTYMTGKEYGNVIRPFDPPRLNERTGETLPVISEVDPLDPSKGLIIKSMFNGIDEETGDYAWVPVQNLQPIQTALSGDFGPVSDEMTRLVAQEGPSVIGGGVLVSLAQKLARNKIKKNLKETSSDLELGLRPTRETQDFFSVATAKEIGLTTVGVASSEALIKFTALTLGAIPETDNEGNITKQAVQPDMTFDRALRESGAVFQGALIGGALGDTFIRGLATAWRLQTGMPVDSSLMDEIILESKILGEKLRGVVKNRNGTKQQQDDFKRISEVLDDNSFDEGFSFDEKLGQQTKGLTVRDQKELSREAARKLAKILKERKRTLGQLSGSDFIQALEEQLASETVAGSKEFLQLQNLSRDNALVLDEFYQQLIREIGQDTDDFVSKEAVNDLFTGARTNKLLDKISEEEKNLLSARADSTLENLVDSPSREARQAAAENVQEQVSTSQSSLFPDQKTRILVEQQQEVQTARAALDTILEQDIYTGEVGSTKMPAFIADSLEKFLNANKQKGTPFGTTDAAEAEEIIRDILPYQNEGFNIAAYLGQERVKKVDPITGAPIIDEATGKQALGLLLPQQPIPLGGQIRARQNLSSVVSGHPNPVVRELGQALIDDFDKMIDASYKKIYKAQTGNSAEGIPLSEIYETVGLDYRLAVDALETAKSEVSGKFLFNLATQPESEIGSFILTSNADQVRGLVSSLSRQDGGLEKLQNLRTLVLESIQKQTNNKFDPNADAANQSKVFAKVLSNHEEQLRALFPEDFVKFTTFPELLDTGKKAVKESTKRLNELNTELESLSIDGKVPSITDTLDMFFGLSSSAARQADQTQIQKAVQAIGKMADEYPDLRKALQGYFGEEILVKQLQMQGYSASDPVTRMLGAGGEDSAFNFDNLSRMFLRPYNTDRALANALEPIVGKDQAFRYAKDLRVLSRQMDQQKGFAGSPLSNYAKQFNAKQAGATVGSESGMSATDTVRKFLYGPLDLTSTRLGILSKFLGKSTENAKLGYLAKIVQDPKKLRSFMLIQEKQLPFTVMLNYMQAIADDREENYGSESRLRELQRVKDDAKNITEKSSMIPAAIQRMFADDE
tara:strand:- start:1260 stop:5192 length:3933 start_codon:yes stop_codon:yes gene_type:complete